MTDNSAHWKHFRLDADQLARQYKQPTSRQFARALYDTGRRYKDGVISKSTFTTHTKALTARIHAAGKPHRVAFYLRHLDRR